MVVPTVTMSELSRGIENAITNATYRKVLEGILNDFMDLQYAKETPYTTGKTVLPVNCTIEDVDRALDDATEEKFKVLFQKISQTYKSGDLTPQSKNEGWAPKLTPVLVLVRADF